MAGVLVCLALPVLVALHVPSVQERIITEGLSRVEKATHLEIKISSYHWNTFSSIYLTGVRVDSGGKRVLDCDDVRLVYRLSIEQPYIVIKEVDLKKPFVRLERDADGKWLLPAFPKPGVSNPPRSPVQRAHISFPRIRITAGSIEAFQQGKTILSVRDFSGAVHLRSRKGASGPGIQMELGHIHARADAAGFGTWDMEISASLEGQELLARKIVLSGPNNSRVLVRGKWNIDHPEDGTANLSLANFSAADIPSLSPRLDWLSGVSGNIDVTEAGGRWTLTPDVSTHLGAMKGVVHIEKKGAGAYAVSLDSHFSGLRVPVERKFPDSKLNGRVKLAALLQGNRLRNADFNVHLDPSEVYAQRVEVCDLYGTFAHGVLNVTGSKARSSLADFTFRVNADMGGLLDSTHKGGIEAQINLLDGQLQKLNPKLPHTVTGRIGIQARYDPGELAKPELWRAKIDANLAIPDILTLKGSASYDKQLLKAVYDLNLADAQKLQAFFPKWQGKGRVVSHGSFEGTWPELVWTGEIDSPRFRYAKCEAQRLSVTGKGLAIGKDGRHVIAMRAQNVVVDGQKFSSVDLSLDQQNDACTFTFSGGGILGQATAQLSGKLQNIRDFPHLSVSTRGRLGWKKSSGAVDARFHVEQDGIKIDSASLLYENGKISTSGGAISSSGVRVPLSLDSIDAEKVSELLGLKARLGGKVSGRLQVSGRPEQPQFTLNIQGKNLVCNGQRIERLSLEGGYSKAVLSVQGTAKAAGISGPVSLTGRIPFELSLYPPRFQLVRSGKLDGDLKFSRLEAKSIAPFFPVLSMAGGELDGSIRCSGTLQKPVLSGEGTWKEGAFEVQPWPHPANNIEAQWRIDSKALYITKAEISHLGGSVSLTGMVEYPDFKTFDIKADATGLDVPDIFGIEAKAAGHAEIKATPEAAELTGTLHLSNASLNLGGLETNLTQHKTIQVVESSTSGNVVVLHGIQGPSKLENKLAMNLRLELPPSGSWVTGKGLKAEINGGITLVKKSGGPLLVAGELHALRGVYSFHGKALKIVDGSVIFPGVDHVQPQLRIVCRKDIRDVTVQALVSGPFKHPKLTLSSIPAMNQVDIVSYFMFGSPAGDLSSAQSSQLQNGAAALLSSEGANIVQSVFGKSIITPDSINYRSFSDDYTHMFSFDQNQANVGKQTGIVEIGKNVTPNLHVVYGREVEGVQGSGNEVQVEYRLNKSFSFNSQVGGEQTGVDVFWRHDFGR